jgi:hypothetical protein
MSANLLPNQTENPNREGGWALTYMMVETTCAPTAPPAPITATVPILISLLANVVDRKEE